MIEIDFNVVATLLLGTRGAVRRRQWNEAERWIEKIEEILDKTIIDKIDDNAFANPIN